MAKYYVEDFDVFIAEVDMPPQNTEVAKKHGYEIPTTREVIVLKLQLVEQEHNNHIEKHYEITDFYNKGLSNMFTALLNELNNASNSKEFIELTFDRDRNDLYISFDNKVIFKSSASLIFAD